jgi:hypothetical protein
MASTQKIIEETVTMLSERYNFDAKEALEYVVNAKKTASPAFARAKKAADATRAKIAELEQKIADNKVKNAEKSAETLAGLRAKLEEQMARIAKFETPVEAATSAVPEQAPKKKRASKKKTEETQAPVEETQAPEPVPESVPAPAEAAPKKKRASKKEAPAPEPVPDAAPKKEKRIARMSPTLSKQLTATFETAKIDFKDEYKKAFAAYINDMEEDAFGTKSLPDHMRDFVARQAPVDEIPSEMPADKKEIVKVTYDELLEANLVDSYGPGIYWDITNKRFVRGPSASADEDVTEVTFEDKTYVVGDESKRVYMITDGADVFAGFLGIGKFKGMTV